MEVIFTEYFAAGVSWTKLISELPINDKGQKFRIRVKNTVLQVARYLFAEEHKDGCCHSLPGGSEYFDEQQQTELKNIFNAHLPDATPFHAQFTPPQNSTLSGIISALIPQFEINSAEEYETVIYIHFKTIPDLNAVNNIIASYQEPEKMETVLFSKKASQNVIITNSGEFLTSIQPNELIVSKNSGQFTSIIAAIAFLNTLQDKAVIIRVYPGVYFEPETITLPDYTCLIGEGSAGNTTIVGAHAGPVINTNAFNFVKNLNIVGGSIGINHNGSNAAAFSLVKDCMIKIASTTGISVSGGVGSLSVSHISIYADQQSAPAGIGVTISGGSFIASELIIQAQVTTGLDFTNGLGTLDLVSVYYAQSGMRCSGSTKIKGTLVNLVDCQTGLHISSTLRVDENPHICLNYLHIDRAIIDIQTDAAANLEFYSGHIDPDKIIKNTLVNISGNFYTEDEGVQQNIVGRNHVHGSLNFLNDEKFATRHLTIFENYFILPENGAGLSLAQGANERIEEMSVWSGTEWQPIKFVNYKNHYWLPLTITHQKTTINGIEDFWIKTDKQLTEIEYSADSQLLAGPETFYLNRARKKKIIYPTSGCFITPIGADTTEPYKIIIKANMGITINGTFFAQNYVETTAAWTATDLQTFSYTATNITLLAIIYNKLFRV